MEGDDSFKGKALTELISDNNITAEKLLSFGAGLLVEWDGDDKGRKIIPELNAYVIVTRGFYDCHSIIFRKNGEGYYKPEISKV